jgi:O-antigen/teichoic acid export membrane protein
MLIRHTAYNFLGLGLPLLVAVGTIPVLISSLGADRFGLLTLIWAVVSYFGLFDLGLGRALTQQLSVAFSRRQEERVAPLVWTALAIMLALGIFAGLLMASLASWGVGTLRAVPDRIEAVDAVYAMAVSMPFIVLTAGLRGVLEARHAFGVINLIRLPMGLFTFIGPLVVVLYFSRRLDTIAWVLVLGRVLACFVHAWFVWRELPDLKAKVQIQRQLVAPLCVSGGWLSVSNVVSPFMGYVDRFVIGVTVSAAAVAYYATPNELVTKLWIIPGALTSVLFPTFAARAAEQGAQAWSLFKQALQGLFVVMLPISVALVLFARELLSLWISPEFAAHSAPVLQLFAVGILINCLAHIPFTLIQSAGTARSTALVHCLELPFFLVALWWFTSQFGVVGAAMAWVLRMIVDTGLMFLISGPLLSRSPKYWLNGQVLQFAFLGALAFGGVLLQGVAARAAWLLFVCAITAAIVARTFGPQIAQLLRARLDARRK